MKIRLSVAKDIIYEDKDIIVCHKKPGIAVQTARPGEPDMESALKNYLKSPYVGIVHRLDQPVEGLLVFAKTQAAAAQLSRQNQGSAMSKKYYAVALLKGKTLPISDEEERNEKGQEQILVDYLVKNGRDNTSVIADEKTKEAKRAELTYKIVEVSQAKTALIHVTLTTGRHHQIRVQLANAGMPLLGDGKYGSEASRKISRENHISHIALCAYSLAFFHPATKKRMEFAIDPAGEAFIPFLPINP